MISHEELLGIVATEAVENAAPIEDYGYFRSKLEDILSHPRWISGLKAMENYERKEDMSPDGKLMLHIQEDGDVVVGIAPSQQEGPQHFVKTAEFCSLSAGGRSPRTRMALMILALAIELDNKDQLL